ncbi:MAG TPA: redox-regulated ATPase YchF [Candidatus Paceibacterota bacterium]
MKLAIGIVGLPNVGKSTLFKVLTRQNITIANYPFATIDPNVGVVAVPDERLEKLNTLSASKKKIPAVVEFFDIAGLVKGANKGEGLGNDFLDDIQLTQAIVMVVRAFQNPDIIHVENSVDPVRDIDVINLELMLKDLAAVDKRLMRVDAEARAGKKEALNDKEILERLKTALESGVLPVSDKELSHDIKSEPRLNDLRLLTTKRQLYLINGKESDVSPELLAKIAALGAEHLVMDLSSPDVESAGIPQLVKKAYHTLDLISFFTTGEDETRAWTIERGMKAPQAAGVIHTDFEAKFIRMEVVPTDKLLEAGGWSKAKQKGWLRVEGKEYVVADGDVIEVRHG